MQSLRLNVLGRFEARWSGGELVDFNSRKVHALLGYLAVEAGHAHTREQLANLLWSRTGEERARHNLRQALAKIRSCCDSLLIGSGETLAINRDVCDVDALEFLRLSRLEDPDALRRCLDLYAGDLLDGMTIREPAFEEWILPAREQLRHTACKAADKLTELLVADERIPEAIEALTHRLVMDPA